MRTVVIDPGHSGPVEPGAVGPSGTREADINLSVAMMLASELDAKGFSVMLTRDGDINNTDLTWRAQVANNANADCFISIHCNSAENRDAEGFEIFTSPGQTSADELANELFIAISDAMPELEARCDWGDGDADKESRFTVLMKTDCPAVLVELEFISNPDGEARLNDHSFRHRYAKALAIGTERFLR